MSDTITINGLHSCKPGNDPIVGQIKTFVIIHHAATETKKAWIKIKAANEESGGTPHRILSAERSLTADGTPYTDKYGNVSFNIEVEPAVATSAFQQARSTMQQGRVPRSDEEQDWPDVEKPVHAPRPPPARSNGGDGVTEARKHLMQSANLYNLCVAAVDKAIAPWMPEVARTSEQFQAAVASLFIEASKEQWWSGKIVKPSLIDSMPTTPIKNGDQ